MSYRRGHNRLFYKSKSEIESDVIVTLLSSELKKINVKAIFVENGLYYIDVWFKSYGSYFLTVYENGEKKLESILVVNEGSAFIPYPDEDAIL